MSAFDRTARAEYLHTREGSDKAGYVLQGPPPAPYCAGYLANLSTFEPGLNMPTIEQLRNAADGKDAQHNGMNKREIEAYLGLPINGKLTRAVLNQRLEQRLLGMPDP